MHNSRYIVKRFRDKNTQAFPVTPVWSMAQPCLGFVSLTSIASVFESLRDIRDNIFGMWTGNLDGLGPVTIVGFETAATIDQKLSAVLPLQKSRDGHLSSFSMEFTERLETQLSRFFTLDIWWKGKIYSINLNALDVVPLESLWPAPEISIHRGIKFNEVALTAEVTQTLSSSRKSAKKAKVKMAKEIMHDTLDVFAGTDRSLKDLEERTKLSNIFKRVLNQRTFGNGGEEGGDAKGQSTQTESKTSILEDLAGWVRWHTPFAEGLMKQMQDRMNIVEKLINKGDIDSALKLALKLGNSHGKEKSKTRFPFRLPEMRSNLDFSFSGSRISMPVLGGNTQSDMWQRYTKLAAELETKGDFKRAAYIRSQLLDSHTEAVLTLERGELYAEAAKLSYDSRQDPVLTIRLYYKAGKQKEALSLARRTGCFDKLAEDSRADNPEFHNLVIKFWTDMLLETHQPLRALEVTDSLVDTSNNNDPDADLLNHRRDWLEAALELETLVSGAEQSLPIDLLVRALLVTKWNGSDFSSDMLQNFPFSKIQQDTSFHKAFVEIQDIINGKHPEDIQFFLSALFQRADKTQLEQAGFWQGPARKFLDVLTRSIMAHHPEVLARDNIVKLQRLLQVAPLPVLSLDLKKVKTFHKGSSTPPSEVSLPKISNARSSQILKACMLFNGSMVVWYDTDRFEHRDRNGKVLWSGNISQVRAILPIGSSPSVLILRQWGDHETRLTLYESHKRKFRDVGIIHLVAWHDVISDREWLVQIDNLVGSIDISKLFQSPAELEFLWSVNTTNELRIMAFFQKGNSSSWMTRNVSKNRFGVKQIWHYKNARELEEFYCKSHFEEQSRDQIDWYWGDNNHSKYGFMRSLQDGEDNRAFVSFSVPNVKLKQDVMAQARKRVENGYEGADTVQVCDYQRPLTVIHSGKGLKIMSEKRHRAFQVKCHPEIGLRLLYRGFSLKPEYYSEDILSNTVLCTDDFGRLIRINSQTGQVNIY